jgi:threonine aldolase
MVHIEMPVDVLEALQADGFGLAPRRMRPGDKESGMRYARLVTSWSTTTADVQHFIDSAVSHLAEVAELSSTNSTPAAKL